MSADSNIPDPIIVLFSDQTPSGSMMDIVGPVSAIEVDIRKDAGIVWINIDGVCRLRITNSRGVEVKTSGPINWSSKA